MSDEDESLIAGREEFLPPIEELLLRADPTGAFSGALVADLDDLAATMAEIQQELAALIAERHRLSPRQIRRRLYRLEITLEEDLPWIIADVLPVLKDIRSRQSAVLRWRRRRFFRRDGFSL